MADLYNCAMTNPRNYISGCIFLPVAQLLCKRGILADSLGRSLKAVLISLGILSGMTIQLSIRLLKYNLKIYMFLRDGKITKHSKQKEKRETMTKHTSHKNEIMDARTIKNRYRSRKRLETFVHL